MTRTRSIRRILFAAAVLGSLGFGASQAFAATLWPWPTEPSPGDCGPDCIWDRGCKCW